MVAEVGVPGFEGTALHLSLALVVGQNISSRSRREMAWDSPKKGARRLCSKEKKHSLSLGPRSKFISLFEVSSHPFD